MTNNFLIYNYNLSKKYNMKKISFLFGLAIVMFATTIGYAQDNMGKPEGLKVGDKAPDFTIKNSNGSETFNLSKALKKGPVVLVFYRGQWCPFCNKHLSQLNDSLSQIQAKGATVVAISPETDENIAKTVEKTKASFAILHDEQLVVMKSYKVNFGVDANTVERYKKYGIDFNQVNGNNGANLPVPATYIIGKNGNIKYVFFNPDYQKRASVKEILDNL